MTADALELGRREAMAATAALLALGAIRPARAQAAPASASTPSRRRR